MTIFAKIIQGAIPCNKVYEDEHILAFHDIAPRAKVHVLVIPKQMHLAGLQDVSDADRELMGYMMAKIPHIAALLGVDKTGYRVVTNNGPHSGQEVPHLHFHILGGEQLKHL
ncbi:MAG: HIT domain-containing protein [Proteobacteria bacterium]|nr:HIT domain-containing protein [Pseudomonadota bacterium]